MTPDPSGDATITVAEPTSGCLFVGGTTNINGIDSAVITGFLQVEIPATSPFALDVRAVQVGGNVMVSFRTDTQVGLAAINIVAVGRTGLVTITSIAPKAGDAGTSYLLSIARGAFKSFRTIVVQTATAAGTTFNSASARF